MLLFLIKKQNVHINKVILRKTKQKACLNRNTNVFSNRRFYLFSINKFNQFIDIVTRKRVVGVSKKYRNKNQTTSL